MSGCVGEVGKPRGEKTREVKRRRREDERARYEERGVKSAESEIGFMRQIQFKF